MNPEHAEYVSPEQLVGARFGRWVVLRRATRAESPDHCRWWLRCDCGVEKAVLLSSLRIGASRSCGCLRREQRKAAAAAREKEVVARRLKESRATRSALRDAGLCYDCKAEVDEFTRCEPCREKRRRNDPRLRRRAAGRCIDCSCRLRSGRARCAGCAKRSNARLRARKAAAGRVTVFAERVRSTRLGEARLPEALLGRAAGIADSDFRRQRRDDERLVSRLRHRAWTKANPEKCREYASRYRAKPEVKERRRDHHREYQRKRRQEMSVDEREAANASQRERYRARKERQR